MAMKTLFLVRHAKSSWDDPSLRDFDRPLNARGKKDAPKMGKRLRKKNVLPNLIISSPAKRARSTAKRIARELGYDISGIQLEESLYHAEPETIAHVIAQLPDAIQTVMVVGHNPGLTDFANQYIQVRIDNIPTCGVVAAQFAIQSWKDITQAKGKLKFFDYPKQVDEQ